MKYVLAIAVLICAGVAYLAAQDEPPEDQRVEFRGVLEQIKLSELSSYVQVQTGETISLDEQAGGNITFVGPAEGTKFNDDAFLLLLQDALGKHQFVLVPANEGWKSVPATEAASHAPEMTRPVAEITDDWKWARVSLKTQDASTVLVLLRSICTRHGGSVESIDDETIELCDRVDRLREMFKVADALTEREKPSVTTYTAPAGLTDHDLMYAINTHFSGVPGMTIHTSIAGDGISVEVTGSARVQAAVVQLVEAMTE